MRESSIDCFDHSLYADLLSVEELMSVKEHPAVAGAVAITAGLIFLRGKKYIFFSA